MKRTIFLTVFILVGFATWGQIDTINIRYNIPSIRFTELDNPNCIIVSERIQVFQDSKFTASVFKANNITENEEFKSIQILIHDPVFLDLTVKGYGRMVELTKSEAEGLRDAIAWGRQNFFAQVSIYPKSFMYSGRYFRFVGWWNVDKPGDPKMSGKHGASFYKKSVGVGESIIREDFTNLKIPEMLALEEALIEALKVY